MSNTIRTYMPMDDKALNLDVTAFMSGRYGECIQFTIGMQYSTLSESQVRDLVKTLQNRLACKRGYQATDCNDAKLVAPKRIRRKKVIA